MTRAVVDVGSNSVLLTVARREGDAWRTVAETSVVTGLGRDTKQTGRLSEPAISDTMAAVRQAFDEARRFGANEIWAAATMAARIAENQAEFLARASAQGTPITVLSGEDEAQLGLEAVLRDPAFAAVERVSIIDPGGHSTELVTADRAGERVHFRRSFPIGTLGLRGDLLAAEAPSFGDRLAAVEELDRTIGLEYLPNAAGKAVVLGATGTNLVTIRGGMAEWQPERVHGAALEYEEVGRAVGWLCGLGDAGRRGLVGIEPGREETIHIGALILERFMHALHVDACAVSVRGWRHAMLEGGGRDAAVA